MEYNFFISEHSWLLAYFSFTLHSSNSQLKCSFFILSCSSPTFFPVLLTSFLFHQAIHCVQGVIGEPSWCDALCKIVTPIFISSLKKNYLGYMWTSFLWGWCWGTGLGGWRFSFLLFKLKLTTCSVDLQAQLNASFKTLEKAFAFLFTIQEINSSHSFLHLLDIASSFLIPMLIYFEFYPYLEPKLFFLGVKMSEDLNWWFWL